MSVVVDSDILIEVSRGRDADLISRWADYGKSHGVELGDALIAAGAVINGATIWTRNRKHYPMKEVNFF
jgi:predicted nucleic acid-binding protein